MLLRTSGHVAQDIWSRCPAYHPAMLPSTSGHVAQDKPCCSGHLAKLPGRLAMLPRTCDGHVAQDIWPCCPGYRVATLHRNQAMLPRISSGRAAEAVRPCCPVHLAMLPRLSPGHVAEAIRPCCPGHRLAMFLVAGHVAGHGCDGVSQGAHAAQHSQVLQVPQLALQWARGL